MLERSSRQLQLSSATRALPLDRPIDQGEITLLKIFHNHHTILHLTTLHVNLITIVKNSHSLNTFFFFAKDVAAPVGVVAEQAATSCPSRRVSVMMGLGKIGQTMWQTMMMLKLRWRCRRQPQPQCANHAPLLCIFQLTTDGIPLPQIFPPSRLIYCSSSMYSFSHLSLL